MRHALVVLLLMGPLGLSACGSRGEAAPVASPAPFPSLGDDVSAQQREAVADEVVTFDEYQAGFEALKACMARDGYSVDDVELYKGIFYRFTMVGASRSSYETCNRIYFEPVDMRWQIAHEDQSETADVIRACLADRGVAPKQGSSPGETMRLLFEQLDELGVSFEDVGSADPGGCPRP